MKKDGAAALYNIVDQIFIANADYLGSYGNAANTVVFPLTVVGIVMKFFQIVISVVVGMAALQGELPVYTDEFRGCVFHTRCPYVCDQCRQSAPQLTEVCPGHRVACYRVDEFKECRGRTMSEQGDQA